jgi:PAS domain S-box-containing protein
MMDDHTGRPIEAGRDARAFVGEAGRHLVTNLPLAMVLTDPHQDDNPIVYVNRAFEQMTGYAASAVIGRNCRFLQGEDRDQPGVRALREGIAARRSVSVAVRNYRADGTPFTNRLIVAPVEDDEGDLFAFLGIQLEVAEDVADAFSLPLGPSAPIAEDGSAEGDMLREMQHRVKNHLQMVSSMIRMQSAADDPAASYGLLSRRVEALSLLYDEFSGTGAGPDSGTRYDVVAAGGYVSRVAATVGALDGRKSVRLNVEVDNVYMRTEQAAQLGLLVSELISNTLQHAFADREEGVVEVRLKELGGRRVRLTVSDDGVGMGEDEWPGKGNLGARIVRGLATGLGGEFNVVSTRAGTIITLDFENAVSTLVESDTGRRAIAGQGDGSGGAVGEEAGSGARGPASGAAPGGPRGEAPEG